MPTPASLSCQTSVQAYELNLCFNSKKWTLECRFQHCRNAILLLKNHVSVVLDETSCYSPTMSQSDFCTDEGQVVMLKDVPLRYTVRRILTFRQFFLAVFRRQVWSMYCKKDSLKYSFGSNQERWLLKMLLLYMASWALFSSHKPVILFKW